MSDLIARINTRSKFEDADLSEDMKKEMGLYTKLEGKLAETYREGDFRKLINYIIDNSVKSENEYNRAIAMDVKNMIAEHDPNTKPFEVYIYDLEIKDYIRSVNDPEVEAMTLEDKIKPYLKHTVIQSQEGAEKELDYIDLVVDLNSKIGYKTA